MKSKKIVLSYIFSMLAFTKLNFFNFLWFVKVMENQIIQVREGNVPIIVPESIFVFAPHPDDELLSCGGTILKYRKLGSKITVVAITKGKGGYTKKLERDDIIEKRKHELEVVKEMLDCELIEMGMDEIDVKRETIATFTQLLRTQKTQVIFMPHPSDVHRTHRKLSIVLKEALYHAVTGKAYGGGDEVYRPLGVFFYESPSCKFQFVQNSIFVYVNISEYWNQKIEIFNKAYSSQAEMLTRVLKWAEATAILRGFEIEQEKAECFIPYTEYAPLRIILH